MGARMNNLFETKTVEIPADYDEIMSSLYRPDSKKNEKSRFIKAVGVRKSAVRLATNADELPPLCLDDSDF